MTIGYFGIVMLMVLAPIPPEVFMPLAGVMVAEGKLNFVYVLLAAVVGFLLSVLPWYLASKYLGSDRLTSLLQRHHRWLMISPEKLNKGSSWFRRHGKQALFFSMLVPGMRSIIAIPAGISGMPLTSFLFYSMLGATFWLGVLTLLGYGLGSRYYLVEKYLGPIHNVIIVGLMIAVTIWGIRRYLKRKAKPSLD